MSLGRSITPVGRWHLSGDRGSPNSNPASTYDLELRGSAGGTPAVGTPLPDAEFAQIQDVLAIAGSYTYLLLDPAADFNPRDIVVKDGATLNLRFGGPKMEPRAVRGD